MLPFAITGVLLVLLAVLATLQWRWIGELNGLERQRMQASLLRSGSHFAEDFDRELTRAFLYFHPERRGRPEASEGADLDGQLERLVRQRDRWVAEAPYPHLLRDLYVVSADARGVAGADELRVLRPGSSKWAPAAWPDELLPLRERLSSNAFGRGGAVEVAADLWALMVPLSNGRGGRGLRTPRDVRSPERDEGPPRAVLLVRLDPAVATGELMPLLVQRYFGDPEDNDYFVQVVSAQDPGRAIFRSDSQGPLLDAARADLQLSMFGVRPFEDLRSLWNGRMSGEGDFNSAPRRVPHSFLSGRPHGESAGAPGSSSQPGAWTLLARRRDGTLEGAVQRVRRRNLGVSLGVLGLLAVTAGVLAVTTARAQSLARQQIEFVAGVSHELNTPLTAIRTAGENLADGVVADAAQVRRYGALISTEGRRLSSMVGQVLDFAGMQSRRRSYRLQSVPVRQLIEGALRDSRLLLEQAGLAVEQQVAADLPPVMADATAMQGALQNLIENAVKHGGQGGWLGVSASARSPGEVDIAIADRGPGVRREDKGRIFEPFFRGRGALAAGVAGSGLGLSLVRHVVEGHGGKVMVESDGPSSGSIFRITLPAVAP